MAKGAGSPARLAWLCRLFFSENFSRSAGPDLEMPKPGSYLLRIRCVYEVTDGKLF